MHSGYVHKDIGYYESDQGDRPNSDKPKPKRAQPQKSGRSTKGILYTFVFSPALPGTCLICPANHGRRQGKQEFHL